MLLNKEAILAADDVQFEDVEVPEWGGTVRVRGMTGKDRDQYELWYAQQNQKKGEKLTLENIRAKLVSMTAIDEQGNLLFTEKDVAALGNKNGMVLDKVFQVARKLNGMGADTEEELEKNSGNSISDDSPSASLGN